MSAERLNKNIITFFRTDRINIYLKFIRLFKFYFGSMKRIKAVALFLKQYLIIHFDNVQDEEN